MNLFSYFLRRLEFSHASLPSSIVQSVYVSLSVFKMHLNRRYRYLDRHGPEMAENYVGAVDKVQITLVNADVQSTKYIFLLEMKQG